MTDPQGKAVPGATVRLAGHAGGVRRELKTDDNLLLLCTDMDSGHGGKSGRFKSYEGVALEYAFLIGLAQGTLPGQADV